MLALTLTFLAAAFILGPDLISRLVLALVVPRRSVTQNRGEEVTRALLWVALPLAIALFWMRLRHVLGLWGSWPDVEAVASGLYSSTYFDAHRREFFSSFLRVAGMCGSLLWRLYLIVVIAASAIDVAILRYRWLRGKLSSQWSKTLLAMLLLPRISEWHVLFSDMLLPAGDVFLEVDVLTKSGTLYQGGVQDRMIAGDGSLQTLTLADPKRFLREEFRKAKEADSTAKTEDYWRPIPGKLFVIIGSDIVSVNIRYLPRPSNTPPLSRVELSANDIADLRNLLAKLTIPAPEA